jgi:hypothetical protein
VVTDGRRFVMERNLDAALQELVAAQPRPLPQALTLPDPAAALPLP